MQGKIAVEEHFAIPDTTDRSMRYQTEYWTGLQPRLLDMHDRRLAEMDRTGIEIEVISLNSNGVQSILDPGKAAALARKACDGGIAKGCSNLGLLYESGTGVAKDLQQAEELFHKACEGGYDEGCKNLKQLKP